MLELFSSDVDRARREYATFLADGLKSGKWQHFYKVKNGIIGDDRFIEQMRTRIQAKEPRAILSTAQHQIVMTELLKAAAEVFKIDAIEFVSASQGRELSRIRQAVAYVGRQLGLSVTELARAFRRGLPAVSSMITLAKKQASEQIERLAHRMNY
jgi:chromosomal replication initiation ATPase DnaA